MEGVPKPPETNTAESSKARTQAAVERDVSRQGRAGFLSACWNKCWQPRTPYDALSESDKIVRHYWREFWWGLALVVVMVLGKFLFETTTVGRDFEEFTYARLQRTLASRPDHHDPRAMLIDIGALERVEIRDPDGRLLLAPVTPRKPIGEMVETLIEWGPLAIGIDIDLSPDEVTDSAGKHWVYKHPQDLEWMKGLAKKAEDAGVPLFFGVGRGRWRGSEGWLGDPSLATHAACLFLWDERDRRKIPFGLRGEHHQEMLPGMGAALSRSLRPQAEGDGKHGGWFLETFSEFEARNSNRPQDPPLGSVTEFLMDFGPLPALMRDPARRASSAEGINTIGEALAGKIVMLGRTKRGEATDTFNIWYLHRSPVPGVFLHVCAALTPGYGWLREFTHLGRLVIDIGVSFVLLYVVTALCCYYKHRFPGQTVNARAGHLLFTFLAVCLVIAGGYLLARFANIMWTDFLLVALALALHQPVHAFCVRTFDLGQRIINEIFLGKSPES